MLFRYDLRRIIALSATLLFGGLFAFAQGMLTDQQVLDYVKSGIAEGKDQKEIVRELALKGVTRSQAQRVGYMYNQQKNSLQSVPQSEEKSRAHTYSGDVPDSLSRVDGTAVNTIPEASGKVYGRSVFRNRKLDFSPSENLATPRNYRLGPGDEIIIDIFGANQSTLRSIISPEGSIKVDVLGPIYLSGMTIDEANTYLKKKLSSIYAGLNRSTAGTSIRLSLGQIRSIQVNILSNVNNPGTYRLSAFSTVFHALYMAGGPNDLGSLRNIQVVRGGEVVGAIDVYEYLEKGTSSGDIRLEDGDVILVPTYGNMVKLGGMVKRPMLFEMKDGETMEDLLEFAGGFLGGAYTDNITVTRLNGSNYTVRTVPKDMFASFALADGDDIEVGKLNGLFENRITITGAVYQPGTYELSGSVHTVKQLVELAGGLLPEAFTGRVVLHREHEDRTMEIISLNLGNIMSGSAPDMELRKNDELQIVSQYDLEDKGTMSISGMVVNPGEYPFAENTTIEDLIIIAGGLQDGASLSKVDVSRRNKDSESTKASDSIAKIYSYPIKNGLIDDGTKGFILEPYDEVIVHRSPSYNIQKHVAVSGEVNFPGTFTMSNRSERLSDLIAKAGGVTDFAYMAGARLIRQRTETEARLLEYERHNLEMQNDTSSMKMLRYEEEYYVTLNLADAIAHPGGPNDILLRENDRLDVPVFNNTIRVTGAVMLPNAISYNPKYKARDYINLCGGFALKARKDHAYIVSMNGDAVRYHGGKKINPGDEIVVPQKEMKQKLNGVQTVGTLSAAIGSFASFITSVALLVNYAK